MSFLFVTYPSSAGARFDRDYYVATHLPLVEEHLGPFGLQSAQAFFPAASKAAHVAVAVLTFSDDGAIDAALSSAETATVPGDLVNFTTIAPKLSRGVPPS